MQAVGPRGGEESVWAAGTWPGRGPTPVAEAQQHPDRPLSQCFHLCHFESFVCVCPRLLLHVFVFAKLTDLRFWPCLCLGPGTQPDWSQWQPCMRPRPSLSPAGSGPLWFGPSQLRFLKCHPIGRWRANHWGVCPSWGAKTDVSWGSSHASHGTRSPGSCEEDMPRPPSERCSMSCPLGAVCWAQC